MGSNALPGSEGARDPVGSTDTCDRCGRSLSQSWRFRFATPDGGVRRLCLRCAPQHPPILRRSLITALVVGTVLTAINQGDSLLALAPVLLWKIPLTYVVPFAVSTYSALAIGREQVTRPPARGRSPGC